MRSGRTLWEELCYKYHTGTEYVDTMLEQWKSLEHGVDPAVFSSVTTKLKQQQIDAADWRDTCLSYFQRFSRASIGKSKKSSGGIAR
jgi:alpha-glucuronidase